MGGAVHSGDGEHPHEQLSEPDAAIADRIRPHLRAGMTVWFADGAGAPIELGRAFTQAARDVGGVRLVLGWSFQSLVELDPLAFPDVRALVGGYGLRRQFRGDVQYLPVRLSAVPALLHSSLRPDVLIAGLRPGAGGLGFGSEISWMPAAIDAGAAVLAEINHGLPCASEGPIVPSDRVTVVHEATRAPMVLPVPKPNAATDEIGRRAASLVRPGDSLQFGPGGVGDAFIRAIDVPVHVDSGMVGDAVVDLDSRGLLVGMPLATYLAGSEIIYRWADEKPILARVEHTHDFTRLASQRLVAMNTALEIDVTGQVNVEGFGDDVIAGVGGHPDFAGAASRAIEGLSVIALPTIRGGRCTLVERLSAPTSTSRCDVDIVVTEYGIADLRGLSDAERARALQSIWASSPS